MFGMAYILMLILEPQLRLNVSETVTFRHILNDY